MLLINFIKSNEFWEEQLKQKPYCLTIKYKNNLALFSYSQIESDFFNPIVRECRGIILDINTLRPVCVPFYKFGNYGEEYVSAIDWETARVQEKVDGSLIKLWWYEGEWHISTNSTIDAKDAPLGSDIYPYKTYYDLFEAASKSVLDYSLLDKDNTYMFELVSPYNRVVVLYKELKIYHIGTRNLKTLEELDVDIGIEKPKSYGFRSLEECIEVAKSLPFNDEGYVVVDGKWNRMKIKSPAYVAVHHLRSNDVITKTKIVSMLKQNEHWEFLSYFPEFKFMIDDVEAQINAFVTIMDQELVNAFSIKDKISRKEFATIAQSTLCPPLLFHYLDGKTVNARDWLMKQTDDKIVYWIEKLITYQSKAVIECKTN